MEIFIKNNIVLSDSLSTPQNLNNTTDTSDIAKLIKHKISRSKSRRINISLIWISGHSNIEEREKAKQEAKKAVKSSEPQNLIKQLVQI
ncbi:unnamed protein product [Macrosiphum euphorbiae]|uniref:RNase H type-1 domain-containing protein n=1 Tax=Macrosiphum euphorbiae TaxID=13131 RepID=A0AAV0X2K6_9HEMI|nr:unnamed protein product [Macrosiphum euphorbiae]